MLPDPRKHFIRVLVRREHRIEHALDRSGCDDERQTLDERHSREVDCGQPEGVRERQVFITQDLERHVEAQRRRIERAAKLTSAD